MVLARTYNIDGMETNHVKWYLLEGADKRVKWFSVIFFLISLGMLIAGSVMLGIGISDMNSSSPVTTPATGYSLFITAQSKNVNYSSVISDYKGSVQILTDQMRQALTTTSSSLVRDSQSAPPITILGISDSGKSAADVLYALSYTSVNTPSIQDITNQIGKSKNFEVLSATDQTASTLTNLECVRVSQVETITTPKPTSAPGQSTVTQPSGVSTTTKTVTQSSVASAAPSTITPFVPTKFSRDILILLDDSTAMLNKWNFDEIKYWIASSLIPQWPVDPQNVQIGFATYANTEFNLILNFNEQDDSQYANVIESQNYTGKYGPNITFALSAASQLTRTRPVNLSTILISDSEMLTDVDNAQQYAKLLNMDPNQLITLSVNGTTNGKQLGLLSTNQNEYFATIYSQFSVELSQSISDVIFNHGTPITPVPTATTTIIPDNSCKTDITIVFDSSMDVGSLDNFRSEISVVRQLVKTWPISLDSVETAAIMYSTKEGGMVVENPFAYQSASAFSNELLNYNDYYFSASPQNLTAVLQYVTQNLFIRRKTREQATVLFTYSSANIDATTVKYAELVGGNLIIVAVGNADQDTLRQLTGNVLYVKTLTADINDLINNLLCTITTPLPLITTVSTTQTSTTTTTTTMTTTPTPTTTKTSPTTTSSKVTTPNSSQTTGTQSTLPSTTTTPAVNNCPDCVPKSENILFLLEAYQKNSSFTSQKALLTDSNLTTTWNHFDRVSLIGFDTTTRFIDPINFGDLQNRDELNDIVTNLNALNDAPTIVSAFNLALSRAQPLASYGKMTTIIFTSGATTDEINAALNNSIILRREGKVIIIGLNIDGTPELQGLCDVFIKWTNLAALNGISEKINYQLNN